MNVHPLPDPRHDDRFAKFWATYQRVRKLKEALDRKLLQPHPDDQESA